MGPGGAPKGGSFRKGPRLAAICSHGWRPLALPFLPQKTFLGDKGKAESERRNRFLSGRASRHAPHFLHDWRSGLLEGAPCHPAPRPPAPTLLGGGPDHTEPLGNASASHGLRGWGARLTFGERWPGMPGTTPPCDVQMVPGRHAGETLLTTN